MSEYTAIAVKSSALTSISVSISMYLKPKVAKLVLYSFMPSLQVYSTFWRGVVIFLLVH